MAGSARLGAYTVSIAFAAAALYHFELSQLGPFQPAFTIPWWLLAALFCAGETLSSTSTSVATPTPSRSVRYLW